MRFGLIYRGNTIPLGQAPTVIGRSAACKIVLDDTGVSRRHARLLPVGDRLVLEDLGSVIGVFVNGERVDGKRDLTHGDAIVVGDHRFEVTTEVTMAKSVKRKRFVTPYAKNQVRRASMDQIWDDEEVVTDAGESTSERSQLELMGRAADCLLAEDRGDEAAQLLEPVLAHVLGNATKLARTDAVDFERAARYALKLACAAHSARWVDYVFELYGAAQVLPSAPLVDELYAAVDRVGVMPDQSLPAYLAVVRAKESSLDESGRQQLARLRELSQQPPASS